MFGSSLLYKRITNLRPFNLMQHNVLNIFQVLLCNFVSTTDIYPSRHPSVKQIHIAHFKHHLLNMHRKAKFNTSKSVSLVNFDSVTITQPNVLDRNDFHKLCAKFIFKEYSNFINCFVKHRQHDWSKRSRSKKSRQLNRIGRSLLSKDKMMHRKTTVSHHASQNKTLNSKTVKGITENELEELRQYIQQKL